MHKNAAYRPLDFNPDQPLQHVCEHSSRVVDKTCCMLAAWLPPPGTD